MIHVFFDCGSFGSTIEYVLHNYTNHEKKIDGSILDDGSMHSFKKEYHITRFDELGDFLSNDKNANAVTTPTYPFKEFTLPKILEYFSSIASWPTDKKILIYQDGLEQAELNLLFKYHKVCTGYIDTGIAIIVGDNRHNLSGWNSSYTHWEQMQPWELREWLSIFYPGFVTEFTTAPMHVSESDWLVLSNVDILFDTVNSLTKIIDYCGLVLEGDIQTFVKQWQSAQQYIVDEYNLLGQIVDCSINNQMLTWEPVNIIAEAIVQQRLRAKGYEIQCDGLNTFPTDSETLYKLLEKV
jgi:hypothetical protein